MKFTLKSPARFAAVLIGGFTFFCIDVSMGWAFLAGTIVGSIKFDWRE